MWQPITSLPSFSWGAPGMGSGIDVVELDVKARTMAEQLADDGAKVAREAGFEAEPVAAQAFGPVWETIIRTADEHDAALIVLGSRGLTGMRNILLGSVSEGVVRHSQRPTLVVPPPDGSADA